MTATPSVRTGSRTGVPATAAAPAVVADRATRPDRAAPAGEPLPFDAMYAAIAGRDPRYDGSFFTAVRTTGIYCRPSCPARTPNRANVTFYPSAAAAQSAGFRACRRCYPDALPGSPLWDAPGTAAATALQLIEHGVVDEEGVDGLTRRLGWSPRTVNRLLTERTGAGPLAHARARRARVAHGLITGTDEPFSDIAFAAGFSSIRQFNDTVLAVYGTSPTRLRCARTTAAPTAGVLRASLPYRPPLDWSGLVAWFGARALPGIDATDDGRCRVALRLPHGEAVATVADDPERGAVRAELALDDLRDHGPACAALRRLLDLDADPVGIDERLRAAGLTASVARVPGIRIPGTPTPLEALLRALTGQQVTVESGRAQLERLVAATRPDCATPEPTPGPDHGGGPEPTPEQPPRRPHDHGPRLRPFPEARAILDAGLAGFRGPQARRETIHAALELADAGALAPAAAPPDVARALAGIKGIGPWTIAYTLLRGYGCPDVDLSTDRAVINGARALGAGSAAEVLATAAPWRSYAALHQWRHA